MFFVVGSTTFPQKDTADSESPRMPRLTVEYDFPYHVTQIKSAGFVLAVKHYVIIYEHANKN